MNHPDSVSLVATGALTITKSDRDWLFRVVTTIAVRHGASVDEMLALVPMAVAEAQASAGAGGKRAGAGRPAADWVAISGGHSLFEIALRTVIERAALVTRTGSAPSDREIFDTIVPPIAGLTSITARQLAARRFSAFQHAVKNPPKSAHKQAAELRAARRARRNAA